MSEAGGLKKENEGDQMKYDPRKIYLVSVGNWVYGQD